MMRSLVTLSILIVCFAGFVGCNKDDKPNPVDENVPDAEVKGGEAVTNPEDLDLFKDPPNFGDAKDGDKKDDSSNDNADSKDGTNDPGGAGQEDGGLVEPSSQGPPIEQPKLKIPGSGSKGDG